MNRAAERLALGHLLACRRDRAHCRQIFVSARAPEILFAKVAIPGRDREAARSRVEEAYAVTGLLPPLGRGASARPCPMLRDGARGAYAARPMTCRIAVSESGNSLMRMEGSGRISESPVRLATNVIGVLF